MYYNVTDMGRDMMGPFEEAVLREVAYQRGEAYGSSLCKALSARKGRIVSLGAIYTTLDRLEEKGFVESRVGDPTPERGGRRKRYYRIIGEGELALSRTEKERGKMLGNVGLEGVR